MRRFATYLTAAVFSVAGGLLAHSAGAETVVVEMYKFKFVPEEVTIKVGDTVRWLNTEKRQYHNIWFKEQGEKESQIYFPGEYYEKTFDKAGVYPYICGTHVDSHDMIGVVHVIE